MKNKILIPALVLALALPGAAAHAQVGHDHAAMEKKTDAKAAPYQLTARTTRPLEKNLTQELEITLADAAGKPVELTALKTVHTKKFHLFLLDSRFDDYHHLHPVAGKKPGTYHVSFTPKTSGPYRVWADVTGAQGQFYVPAHLNHGVVTPKLAATPSLHAHTDGYDFTLKLDGSLKAGAATMASITVIKQSDKSPVKDLQPVLGAFAHIVGFSSDMASLAHIHPVGAEPTTDNERAGPAIFFHMEPKQKGLMRLFAQFLIAGKDIFVPFTVRVE